MGGLAGAKKGNDAGQVVHLNKKGKIPAKFLPPLTAKNAKKLGGKTASQLTVNCPIPNAIDLGTWCLESGTYPVPPKDAGKNDYLYATSNASRRAAGCRPPRS